ncbi:NAD(P)-dependent dehydrogenase (short-subunit alcohol dehydrogenase family) [Catenuloplanes nepalensis]|uniref:NAD(P)-dependent dehydrogenase (Short-subunit alcohol dehydrogenase family) n=1 Tax=Catenuloplanes nepalensis TaxID=587533 RepID=A0ABT9MUN7_9ACTN|nr:SDR family NAD(P)-dependent oxidoreductase [Catenuloplanes nepalensis]MDP9795161.1 NAD(P)-dependent dehydrogenase (short-subunit alcohol dehydrogenase family) [Catenuloplanes nepalensis]
MAGAIIIGAGPGIGRSVALRFARAGMPVALISRTTGRISAEVTALGVRTVTCLADAADDDALRTALDHAMDALGPPDAVVYNVALIRPDTIGELGGNALRHAWTVNVGGAITAAAHVLPGMARRGHGTFVVTGGMPEPKPEYVSLSLGKAAVRALVDLLDRQYGPAGAHIATVTVAGPVAPGTPFDPDDIADRYWHLHTQPRSHWQREIIDSGAPESIAGRVRSRPVTAPDQRFA